MRSTPRVEAAARRYDDGADVRPADPAAALGDTPIRRNRRWPWVLLVLAIIAGGAWYAHLQRTDRAAATAAAAAVPAPPTILSSVEISRVAPQDLQAVVKLTGGLVPETQTTLGAQVAGTISAVTVKAGQRVTKGEVLVRFDTRDLAARLEQQKAAAQAAEAQVELTRATLQRTRALAKTGAQSDAALDTAKANADAAAANLAALRAQVTSAETSLDEATIVAPFTGTVSERLVDPGQAVGLNTKLLSLVDLDTMVVQAAVPTSASGRIKIGQTADIAIDGIEGRTFRAKVDRINPVAISGSRSIMVYLTLPNPDHLLRGGMFASGHIVTIDDPRGLAVPPSALRIDQQGTFVLKVVDGKLVRQPVTRDREWNGGQLVSLKSGIGAGDVVVSAPLPELQAGMSVNLQQD
jgi:RND family efflux transporter MFP subunit